ncbi:MAG: GatB/YqeY domain-containing protein [Euzebyaceae bacterium]|nr:GatB/YqeY domain-containing protein [Euzebyaceae bacterium]
MPLTEVDDKPVVGRSADVARRELDDQQLMAVVRAEYQECVQAAALYERLGRPGDAAAVQAEATILMQYLVA